MGFHPFTREERIRWKLADPLQRLADFLQRFEVRTRPDLGREDHLVDRRITETQARHRA